jgi:hypothetical protein
MISKRNCTSCKWRTTLLTEHPQVVNGDWYFNTYVCDNPSCGLVQTWATPLKKGA